MKTVKNVFFAFLKTRSWALGMAGVGLCFSSLSGHALTSLSGEEVSPPSVKKDPKRKEDIKIAAVVNNEVITLKDLTDRLRLVILSSGMADTQENRHKLTHQVLKTLIEERLQLAEMKRAGIIVPEEEVSFAFESLEKQNQMPSGALTQFLKQKGIPKKTLEDQAKAQIGFGYYVRAAFPNAMQIDERAIDKAIEEMEEGADKPHYLLSEIFLAVESPQQERAIQKNAQGVFDQLRLGAPFPFLAQQFSKSASAATGGDIGWVREDQLDPAIEKVLKDARPVVLTAPIRTQEGYYILALRDKKILNPQEADDEIITFKNVRIDLGQAPSAEKIKEKKKALRRLKTRTRSCDTLDILAKSVANAKVREFEEITHEDLPPHIEAVVKNLEVGVLSDPLVDQGNVVSFMVCERRHRSSEDGRRDQVLRRLQREKLTQLANRLLRDIKQSAYIDIRV
jgi:peptidyl-prolyl cis-trans isomerase SurA